jgi:hypothetical protein
VSARYYEDSQVFSTPQMYAQRETTRNGKKRWKVITPKGNLYFTKAQMYDLADVLDQALDWQEELEDSGQDDALEETG